MTSGYYDIIFLLNYDYNQQSFSDYIHIIIAGFWSLIAIAFFSPLGLLIFVQTKNFLTNTTTNERFSRNPASPAERNDSDNEVDRTNLCKNIITMCCNTQIPVEKTKSKVSEEKHIRFSSIANEYEQTFSHSNSA